MNIEKSKNRTICKTVCGGNGATWSIQVEAIPLKTKKRIKKPGAYRPYKFVNGKCVKNPRYIYEDQWTFKVRGRYSNKFLTNHGGGSKNRNWGQISCEERECEKYVKAMEKAIIQDVRTMIWKNDGNVIRRDKLFIQQRYWFQM